MSKPTNAKTYDLEERTLVYARNIRLFAGQLPRGFIYVDDIRQLLRSSGSIGANYREANESLGKKDFLLRLRIARKEAKETKYWLDLLLITKPELERQKIELAQEATELLYILTSIIKKSE